MPRWYDEEDGNVYTCSYKQPRENYGDLTIAEFNKKKNNGEYISPSLIAETRRVLLVRGCSLEEANKHIQESLDYARKVRNGEIVNWFRDEDYRTSIWETAYRYY